jgi:hypothetical protein
MKWARQIKCYVVLSITSVFSHYLNDIYKFASMNNVAVKKIHTYTDRHKKRLIMIYLINDLEIIFVLIFLCYS